MTGEIVGNYRVCELVGEGGMGRVYRAIDLALEREVALKALHPDLARQPEIVGRFRSEAVTLARLSHINIAGVYNLLQFEGACFIVMEFLRGRTLDQQLRDRGGAMTAEAALPVFAQILDGLDFAHRGGVLHRDIKPANIFIQDGGVVKLTDFGIARIAGQSRQTRAGRVVGTLEYMSPERIRAEREDGRSDLYAAAAVLYEMLAGSPPFNHESEYDLMRAQIEEAPRPLAALKPGLPAHLPAAIERALAKKPDDRFVNAQEFKAALDPQGMATGLPRPVAPAAKDVFIPAVPQAGPVSAGSGLAFRLMAAAAVALVALFAWFLFRSEAGGRKPTAGAGPLTAAPPVAVPSPALPPIGLRPAPATPPPAASAAPAPRPPAIAPLQLPPRATAPRTAAAPPKLTDDVKKGLDDILSPK